jgi:hypothetical protein
MSRRSTPHAKRERSRERRALDRAILRWANQCSWTNVAGKGLEIHPQDQIEIVGLVLARRRM